jgi:hypothetical protein
MHADRTNRFMALLLAVLLIAAGGIGAAAGYGAFGSLTEHGALTANRVGAFIGRNGDWLWPVAAVVALVVALLALRWLLTLLLSTDRSGDLAVANGSSVRGRTTLASGALTAAVSEEIRGYRGVDSARSRLVGDPEEPALVVNVSLEDTADLALLRRRIETGALAHARTALGNPSLPTRLDLGVATNRSTRVG